MFQDIRPDRSSSIKKLQRWKVRARKRAAEMKARREAYENWLRMNGRLPPLVTSTAPDITSPTESQA